MDGRASSACFWEYPRARSTQAMQGVHLKNPFNPSVFLVVSGSSGTQTHPFKTQPPKRREESSPVLPRGGGSVVAACSQGT